MLVEVNQEYTTDNIVWDIDTNLADGSDKNIERAADGVYGVWFNSECFYAAAVTIKDGRINKDELKLAVAKHLYLYDLWHKFIEVIEVQRYENKPTGNLVVFLGS